MVNRKYQDGTPFKSVGLSLSLSSGLLDELDKYRDEHRGEYASRSDLIEKICRAHLEQKLCPRCHSQNLADATFCSSCGRNFDLSLNEKLAARRLFLKSHPEYESTEEKIVEFELSDTQICDILMGKDVREPAQVEAITAEEFEESLNELKQEWDDYRKILESPPTNSIEDTMEVKVQEYPKLKKGKTSSADTDPKA